MCVCRYINNGLHIHTYIHTSLPSCNYLFKTVILLIPLKLQIGPRGLFKTINIISFILIIFKIMSLHLFTTFSPM